MYRWLLSTNLAFITLGIFPVGLTEIKKLKTSILDQRAKIQLARLLAFITIVILVLHKIKQLCQDV